MILHGLSLAKVDVVGGLTYFLLPGCNSLSKGCKYWQLVTLTALLFPKELPYPPFPVRLHDLLTQRDIQL
jgi:hypothetical protein